VWRIGCNKVRNIYVNVLSLIGRMLNLVDINNFTYMLNICYVKVTQAGVVLLCEGYPGWCSGVRVPARSQQ
jgi:hypothetical protein